LKKNPKKPNFSYSDVAKHAAKKTQRFQAKQQQQDTDEIYRVAKLFKSKQNSYRIEKIKEYKFDKFIQLGHTGKYMAMSISFKSTL